MVDKSLNFYILSGCSLLLLILEFGTAWFFWRMKQRIATLPESGREAEGIITGYASSRSRTDDTVLYSFKTADGRQCKGRQIFPPGFSVSAYPKEAGVSVLYLEGSPSVSCLKKELENKLQSMQGIALVAKILPFSAFLMIGVLWYSFYLNHLI